MKYFIFGVLFLSVVVFSSIAVASNETQRPEVITPKENLSPEIIYPDSVNLNKDKRNIKTCYDKKNFQAKKATLIIEDRPKKSSPFKKQYIANKKELKYKYTTYEVDERTARFILSNSKQKKNNKNNVYKVKRPFLSKYLAKYKRYKSNPAKKDDN